MASVTYNELAVTNLGPSQFPGVCGLLVMLEENSYKLSDTAPVGTRITIKDAFRNATTIPKVITGTLIDGASSYTIATNGGAVTFDRVTGGWALVSQYGSFGANPLLDPGVLFANLPVGPPIGTQATILDANSTTWGAVVVGGGADTILAQYNAAGNWTVLGL